MLLQEAGGCLGAWAVISSLYDKTDDFFVLAAKQALDQLLSLNSISIESGMKLLLAFSGGPDSTALLAATAVYARELGVSVFASHINHGLRGAESDSEQEFCRSFCCQLGIPLQAVKLKSAGFSEDELRSARYEELEQAALRVDAKFCLTAHTLDDQVETMLFRLFRGTGLSGLLGIPSMRKYSDRFVILRPLLNLSRADCLSFLQRIEVSACQDSSNNGDFYTRNFIRNRILPLVESRFASYRKHLEQLRRLVEADEHLLRSLTADALLGLGLAGQSSNVWSIDSFNELPLSLRRRALYESFRSRKIEHEFNRIESVLELIDMDGESSLCLNDEWKIQIGNGELKWIQRPEESQKTESEDLCVQLREEGLTFIHKLGLAVKMDKIEDEAAGLHLPGAQDYEVVGDLSASGLLMLRLREAGDQIQPLGMSCMVRLKKYLHTHKSTKTLSFGGRVLVLANENEVLWVPGCGISQRIAVGEKATHRISLIKIAEDSESVC